MSNLTPTPPKLTIHNFFHSYIFSRKEAYFHLSERDQKIVKIAKFIISKITLGIVPILCERKWGAIDIENCRNKVKHLAADLRKNNYFNLSDFVENSDLIKLSKKRDCDRILNGLFLGSSGGFVEATTLTFKTLQGVKLAPTEFTNKYEFKAVISMCPLTAIEGDYTELDINYLAPNFASNKITWIQPGKDLPDEAELGRVLAYNATFPNSKLVGSLIGAEISEIEERCENKIKEIENYDIHEWFKPVFVEMDKAVLGRGNTLVHCQAGVSRSATLVAAYLINRFDLSVEESVNYLKHKRACVNPKFLPFLKDYAKRLTE